jgi:hypothetical protein
MLKNNSGTILVADLTSRKTSSSKLQALREELQLGNTQYIGYGTR